MAADHQPRPHIAAHHHTLRRPHLRPCSAVTVVSAKRISRPHQSQNQRRCDVQDVYLVARPIRDISPLKRHPVARRHHHRRINRSRPRRIPEHHSRFGPRIGIRIIAHPGDDAPIAAKRFGCKIKLIRRPPDVRAAAPHRPRPRQLVERSLPRQSRDIHIRIRKSRRQRPRIDRQRAQQHRVHHHRCVRGPGFPLVGNGVAVVGG